MIRVRVKRRFTSSVYLKLPVVVLPARVVVISCVPLRAVHMSQLLSVMYVRVRVRGCACMDGGEVGCLDIL